MYIFVSFLKVVFLLTCVVLIFGVLFMNQKSEGLSGIMGGMSQSMRGVKGMDEGMRKFVTTTGVVFVVLALIIDIIGI